MSDDIPEEDSYEEPEPVVKQTEKVDGRSIFTATTHGTVTAASGAVFSLSPGLSVRVSTSDADSLVAQGVGTAEGV